MNDWLNNLPQAVAIIDNNKIIAQNTALDNLLAIPIIYQGPIRQLIEKYQQNLQTGHYIAQQILCKTLGGERHCTITISRLNGAQLLVTIMPERHDIDNQNQNLHQMVNIAQGLSHELRNPLASIIAAAQLCANDHNQHLTQIIIDNAQRINNIIARIDEFGQSQQTLAQSVNLYEILHPTIESFKIRYKIHFITEFDPSLPPIYGDKTRYQQIFNNILENAIHATQKKPNPTITIQAKYTIAPAYPHLKCMVVIADNGGGISPEILNHIFQPFISGRPGGSGLGLALCAKYMADYGGKLTAQNTLEGAEFTLFLPSINPL